MKYQLIAIEEKFGKVTYKNSVEVDEPTLNQLLDVVDNFIRGVGFSVDATSRLEYVKADEVIMGQEEYLALVEQAEGGELTPLEEEGLADFVRERVKDLDN